MDITLCGATDGQKIRARQQESNITTPSVDIQSDFIVQKIASDIDAYLSWIRDLFFSFGKTFRETPYIFDNATEKLY